MPAVTLVIVDLKGRLADLERSESRVALNDGRPGNRRDEVG
jgi:hypothetical protein